MRQLAEIALRNGIRYFAAEILVANTPMRKVISDAGWHHTTRYEGPELQLRIDLTTMIGQNAEKTGKTWGRQLRCYRAVRPENQRRTTPAIENRPTLAA